MTTSVSNTEYEVDIEQKVEERAEGKKDKKQTDLWLHSWQDHLAGVKAYSNCIELADINGDGDYKLVVADASKRLKIYSGTTLVNEIQLIDVPSAVCAFYIDYRDEIRRPNVAVASGPYVFIYKLLRPYYKFTLPPIDINPEEQEAWTNQNAGRATTEQLVETLDRLKDGGVVLSTRSIDCLAIEDPNARTNFVGAVKNPQIVQHTIITCMSVLSKDREEPGSLGCLVVGTENSRLLVLDSTGAQIIKKFQLPSVPVFMVCAGLYDVEYRILIGCRNGNIYSVKNGELLGVVIEVDGLPVALARMENQLAVATMNNNIHLYHLKGKKQGTIYLPHAVTNMCSLYQDATRSSKAIIVALANAEVRVYVGKALLNKIDVADGITGLKFGRYGREDSTLIVVLKSGAIVIKMLPRTAKLEVGKSQAHGPPPEQDIPLKVPKRTQLYIDQTKREREFAVDMHRVFQRDLCKLRLQSARAYVKILTDGQSAHSFNTSSSLRLTAHVQGLGPLFKIKLNVHNTGTKPLTGIPIIFTYNMNIYRLPQAFQVIPCLVPSLVYQFEIPVHCLDDQAGGDVIRVYVCNPQSNVPIITALVNMPVADFLMGE